MAPGVIGGERRFAERCTPEQTRWEALALLRPGQDVVLVNLGSGGALVESPTRLAPAARIDLQLFGGARCLVRGRLERCRVSRLEPLRYEGVIVFEQPLELRRRAPAEGMAFPVPTGEGGLRESVTRATR